MVYASYFAASDSPNEIDSVYMQHAFGAGVVIPGVVEQSVSFSHYLYNALRGY